MIEIELFKGSVAERLGLSPSELYNRGLSLSDVLVNSPTALNSIDLMEAFAFAMAEHGLEERLKIPVFTLDNSVDEVMAEIENQLNSTPALTIDR